LEKIGGGPAIIERTKLPSPSYAFSIRNETGVQWIVTSGTGENSAQSLRDSGEASDLTLKVTQMF
jgi:hypothetical protein